MTARKKKPTALTGKKAAVFVERNGLTIRVDDVDAAVAGMVAADMLEVFRALQRAYPELVPILDTVPGGTPIDTNEDEWADDGRRKKRVGFE